MIGYPKYQSYRNDVAPWLGEVPSEWAFERGKWIHSYSKVLNSDGCNQNVLSLTLRGVVNNDPENPEGLIPSDYRTYQVFDKHNLVFKLIDLENVRTSRVGLVHENGIMSSAYIRIIPSEGTDPKFIYYFYYHLYQGEVFNKLGSGVRSTLNKGDLLDLPVPDLPLETQTAIAGFLDDKTARIDELVGIKRRQIALLGERKQILIQNAVTKGLNPNAPLKDSGVDWIGNIPAHWEVKRLASMGRFSKGGGFSKADLAEEGVNAVLYGDIYTQYDFVIDRAVRCISPAVAEGAAKLAQNDLLFTGSGETKEDIGKCVVFRDQETTVAGGDVIIFRQAVCDSLFLSYSLNTDGAIEEKAKSSKGEIIVHTYGSKLREIFIPIPPKAEQESIAEFISDGCEKINAAITIKQIQITKLNEYKTTLINAAVTGKIKVG